ncbi:putative Ig domain-containing protein [Roseibium sp. MB-4]
MPKPLGAEELSILSEHVEAGDRIAYYGKLEEWGYRYGALAGSVVANDSLAGATANIYFVQEYLQDTGSAFGFENLANVSLELMRRDFVARQTSEAVANGGDLSVDAIRDYHSAVFADFGAQADSWTPYVALQQLQTLEERQALWDGMLDAGTAAASFFSYLDIITTAGIGNPGYIFDVSAAGALAGTATSTDYGPYTVAIGNGGSAVGGNADGNGSITGTSGNDVLMGFDGDDVLTGNAGEDRFYGGNGYDTYIVSIAHNTSSQSTSVFYDAPDGLKGNYVFNPLVADSVDFVMDLDGLGFVEIKFEGGDGWLNGQSEYMSLGEARLVKSTYSPVQGTAVYEAYRGDSFLGQGVFVERDFIFYESENYGALFGLLDYQSGDSGFYLYEKAHNGTNANDVSIGTNDSDYFSASAGFDVLIGGAGSDTYGEFGKNWETTGIDVVEDIGAATDVDRLEAYDYGVNDVSMGRGGTSGFESASNGYSAGSNDLVMRFTSSYEENGSVVTDAESSVIIKNYFLGTSTAIETIALGGGTSFAYPSVSASFVYDPTQGADTLTLDDEKNIIDGQGGNDTIEGLGGDDILLGGAGADTLRGGAGNDTLAGGLDGDTLEGGEGADTLNGSFGDDTLSGGVGGDWLFGNEGTDSLEGGDGADVLSGGDGNDTLNGGSGSDTYSYWVHDGNDIIRETGLQTDQDTVVLNGLGAEDIALERNGPEFADLVIRILSTNETILVEGHFLASQNGSADTSIELISISGTRGDGYTDAAEWDKAEIENRAVETPPDNRAPEVANPIASQTSPEDSPWSFTVPANTFSDADGDALTFSTSQADGSALPTWLTFDTASQTFSGTPPQDFNGTLSLKVTASDGQASVDNTFNLVIDPVNDAPVIAVPIADQTGTAGTAWSFAVPADTFADVDGDQITLNATLSDGSVLPAWVLFEAASRTFSGTLPAALATPLSIKVIASDGSLSVEEVFNLAVEAGTPVGQTLTGTSGADVINGGAGDDVISGLAGNDTLNGGAGADEIYGGDGDDAIYVDAADTIFTGDGGVDTLHYLGTDDRQYALAQGGFEHAVMGSGNNTVWGTENVNHLDGGAGGDVIHGYGGNDILTGGAGADSLMGGEGDDTIYADAADSWFSGDAGTDTLIYTGTNNFEYALAQGSFEKIYAGAGDNKIWGSNSAEEIYTEAGNDFVQGGGGNDVLDGGDGSDSLQGQGGDDVIYADAEDSWFSGDAGIDTLVYTGNDDRQISLGQGGFEHARMGSGNNTAWGTGDANILEGEAGNDVLFGYGGADRLTGGTGNDYLVGGTESDTFVFFAGNTGHDIIADFTAGSASEDVVQFESSVFASFSSVLAAATDDGTSTTITIDHETTIVIQNITVAGLHQDDFQFA